MKKAYEKPELHVHEDLVFEKVYAGGCSKVNTNSGCYYSDAFQENGGGDDPSKYSAHKNLAPAPSPGTSL